MRFDSYFAGCNEYPYLSLYSGMVVFFADTGTDPYIYIYTRVCPCTSVHYDAMLDCSEVATSMWIRSHSTVIISITISITMLGRAKVGMRKGKRSLLRASKSRQASTGTIEYRHEPKAAKVGTSQVDTSQGGHEPGRARAKVGTSQGGHEPRWARAEVGTSQGWARARASQGDQGVREGQGGKSDPR